MYPEIPKIPSGTKLKTKIEGNIYTGIRYVRYDFIDYVNIYGYGGTYGYPYKEYLLTNWTAGLGLNVSYRARREFKTKSDYVTYEDSDYYVYGQDIKYTLSNMGRLIGYYDNEVTITSEEHSFEYIENIPIKGIYRIKNVKNIEYKNIGFPSDANLIKNKKFYQVIGIETGYNNKTLYYIIYDKDRDRITKTLFEVGDVIFVTLKEQNSPKFFTEWILENTRKEFLNMVLYKNSAEHNRVDKTDYLTQIGMLQGTFREPFTQTGGSIIIQLDNPPTFNYVYIQEFDRYYFVDDFTVLNHELYEISLTVDVIMSFKNAILSLSAFVDRNEFVYNENIPDIYRMFESGFDVETIAIENDFLSKGASYILSGLDLSLEVQQQ